MENVTNTANNNNFDFSETELTKTINKAVKENDERTLRVLHFLLKKMEYTQKKKNNAKDYIDYIEAYLIDVPVRGFNPMK